MTATFYRSRDAIHQTHVAIFQNDKVNFIGPIGKAEWLKMAKKDFDKFIKENDWIGSNALNEGCECLECLKLY